MFKPSSLFPGFQMNGNESRESPFQLLEFEHAKNVQLEISQPESSNASETSFEFKELDTGENDLQLQKDTLSRNICKIADLTLEKKGKSSPRKKCLWICTLN